ncbi:MAG TPA: hypothetical protein VE871_08165 [Longimicrobium sp.]|nr:hypothetical protein [Longimicrobium sp.]
MRRRLAAILLFAAMPGAAAAQRPDSLAQQFEVDFAIPDAPALELLQAQASGVLRPTTVRALTAGLSDLFQGEGGGLQVPNAFAIEAAPFLLARGHRLTLPQYRANPALYRTRVSAAARRHEDTGNLTGIALGLRLTLADDADLRMNPAYIDSATVLSAAINEIYVNARIRAGRPPAPVVLTAAEQDSVRRLIEPFRTRWAQTRWNANVFDLAAGLMASADSLGNDLEVGQLAAWGTWGRGWADWGQLLVGGRGTFGHDLPGDDRALGGSLGARFYAGTNAYKVFLEGQGSAGMDDRPGWRLHTGGEARLYNRLWATFSAAVDWAGSGDGRLSGRFSIQGAAPPLF